MLYAIEYKSRINRKYLSEFMIWAVAINQSNYAADMSEWGWNTPVGFCVYCATGLFHQICLIHVWSYAKPPLCKTVPNCDHECRDCEISVLPVHVSRHETRHEITCYTLKSETRTFCCSSIVNYSEFYHCCSFIYNLKWLNNYLTTFWVHYFGKLYNN